jgi:cell division protein FtsB
MSTRAQTARGYRLRPAPRRGARGRRPSRVRWDKLGRVVLVFVLFVILASYVNPVIGFYDAWRGNHAQRAEVEQLKREHSSLGARAAALKDATAASEAARKLGMVAEGERSYFIKGLPK